MAKIFVGMSGGVDSTMAAALLKDDGHEVVGITLKLWDDASRCCNAQDILDAGRACRRIGIRHYVLNFKKDFKKSVVDYFINSYLKGVTPNPCVVCNEEVKFRALFDKMREHNFDFVATGHYARISHRGGVPVLTAARDASKSQEYFLSRLKAQELGRILFPLGNYKKRDIIALAKGAGLYVEKPESQEACFLRKHETPYEFIKRSADTAVPSGGEFYSASGGKLADIKSAPYFNFTVGQRKGLGYAAGEPKYVVRVDAATKRVILGNRDEAMRREFTASQVNVLYPLKKTVFTGMVKVRYKHQKAKARIEIKGGSMAINFAEPQFAVAPGQLAVVYKGNAVAVSGFIDPY